MSSIQIVHETLYSFSQSVFIEPHILRLLPKTIGGENPKPFELEIEPKPSGLKKILDEENNYCHVAWFDEMSDHLKVKSTSVLPIAEYNPFDYLIYPFAFQQMPVRYSDVQNERLALAKSTEPIGAPLIQYGQEMIKASDGQVSVLLTKINTQIHSDFETIYREEGDPYTPDKTWELKKGSCRDLSWMQIQLLRSMGFACRFVSGYFFADIDAYELHAWVEVFIPGGGWIGFDPSYGIAAGSTHFPMSVSSHYENTMPVTGTFRGSATSKLSTKVVMSPVE